MRKNSCLFDTCKKNLLGRERSTLTQSDRDHLRRYHQHKTHSILLKGVMFRFRRDPSLLNEYVCVCKTRFSSYNSLENHILGHKRGTYTQTPCRFISDKATEVALAKDVCEEDEKPINYCPASAIPHRDEQDEEPNQIDEIVDEDPDNSDEDIDMEPDNNDEKGDYQQVLEKNERALHAAIQALEKAQSDIKALRAQNKW